MKRPLVWILLLVLLLPAGCAREEAAEPWPLRVTAVLPHDDDDYWCNLGEEVLLRAGELGIDAQVVWPQLNYNIPQMTELIREAAASRVDAIIAQGAEDEAYQAALAEAADAGIQVVLVDTDIAENPGYLYVGTDNLEAGRTLGRELIRITGGACTAAVISGSEHLSNMDQRLRGLEEAVAGTPGITLCRMEYGNYDSITIIEKYHLILQEEPEVDTILCLEGTGCIALGRVLTPENCPLAHVLGFDLTEETCNGIRSGLIDGVVSQEAWRMGRIALEEIQLFDREGTYSGPAHYTDISFVTAENIDEALSEAADHGR